MSQLIECVPNFSEGRDLKIINQISSAIKSVKGVKLINVDPGKAANRTVITFVGAPDEVCEAAFRAVKIAGEIIDMRIQHGTHPRFGAIDVLPLVPISGITMDETVIYTRKLGKRIGDELNIPIYCYEFAAYDEKRRNLANCRAGEYEGLSEKMKNPLWKPDFGPDMFTHAVAKTGAIALGARNILIAYNINLNTSSVELANSIASEIREKGTVMRQGDSLSGAIIKDTSGKTLYKPGLLKSVKGIGWYIEEYGKAQLSFNLTDISITSVHQVFEAACERANAKGIKVTGSELIGLIPLQALLDAGVYFLKKENQPLEIPESEIIKNAVKYLGLDELAQFNPREKVIEYLLKDV